VLTEALLHQFLGTTPAGLLTANEVDGTASAAAAAGRRLARQQLVGMSVVKHTAHVVVLL
jgi:hypothetical protein